MKKLRVLLDIEVSDLPENMREQLIQDLQTIGVTEVETLDSYSAEDVANVLDGYGGAAISDMIFEGTNVFVQFDTMHVVHAQWVTE
jgi:hypothetical protein